MFKNILPKYDIMENSIEIYKIADIIKRSLPSGNFKIIGEVSNPKFSHGHLFFNLKDERSSIKTIMWSSKIASLQDELKDGDKIIMMARIDYYESRGAINLVVENIISVEGQGKIYKRYIKYIDRFKKLGYFDKEKKKKLPNPIRKILIATSETGAAIQDFFYNIKNNKSLLKYDIMNVPVQGERCPRNIINGLKNCKTLDNYDIIIITRGGGSFEDLFGFSKPKLIEYIYNFEYPIMSAIGHMVDNPILDMVADFSSPTPSLAGQFIIDHNKSYIRILKNDNIMMKDRLEHILEKRNRELQIMKDRLQNQLFFLQRTKISFKENIKSLLDKQLEEIASQLKKLENMENNKDVTIFFGKKKTLDFDTILKKLEKNRSIRIVSGNRKITISNYDIKVI
tara:strand:- start:1519 stop:2709 length:1191 start_codon:yes stop_codon:yes gene_type:complete